jgi:NADH-quinone oxidoreductase subunit C
MSETPVIESSFAQRVQAAFGDRHHKLECVRGEWSITVPAVGYWEAMQLLRDHPELRFEQLIDLCGLDYEGYAGSAVVSARFAVAVQLLSVTLNQRIRVKVFCVDDAFPSIQSVVGLWSSANWYEREAFDLYGIVFEGHEDLRRILTDYGFIGHPFRKDFPLSGHVEMRYDATRQRVVYEPVSIEPRENTPRIVREDNYGGLH